MRTVSDAIREDTAGRPSTDRGDHTLSPATAALHAVEPRCVRQRVRIGKIDIDPLRFHEVLDIIDELVSRGRGGAIFTPNINHIVEAESNHAFQVAYRRTTLAVADGMPLIWLSQLIRSPLPERVAGSELTPSLMELAARRGWRVYLLGGAPGVAEEAGRLLERRGVRIVGWDAPRIERDGSDRSGRAIERVRAAQPDLLLVALGAPKQELWIDRSADQLGSAVALGVGGSLDFLVGRRRKAPYWVSAVGLEWFFRLIQEPRRLWRRYFFDGLVFVRVAYRTWRTELE